MKTQADVRNSLGDDISWKTLYAQQNKIYQSREEALVDSILWCSRIDAKEVVRLLNLKIKSGL